MANINKKYILSTAAGKSDNLLEIGDREFRADPLTLREANEFNQDRGVSILETMQTLAPILQSRALDGKPVDTDFLMDNVTKPFLEELVSILVDGRIKGGDNPK